MDVIKKSKLIAEEKNSKNSTKVVIITSIDDDQVNNPILSCLNPANFQTIMWDMNPAESLRTNNNELVGEYFRVVFFRRKFREF